MWPPHSPRRPRLLPPAPRAAQCEARAASGAVTATHMGSSCAPACRLQDAATVFQKLGLETSAELLRLQGRRPESTASCLSCPPFGCVWRGGDGRGVIAKLPEARQASCRTEEANGGARSLADRGSRYHRARGQSLGTFPELPSWFFCGLSTFFKCW